jgi:hypothetical protein
MTTPSDSRPPSSLTDEEEVTLRRVAFGQSEVRAMRAHDLARLRRLQLIEDGRDGPQLTAAGRAVFDELPKAMGSEKRGRGDDMMQQMVRMLRDVQR